MYDRGYVSGDGGGDVSRDGGQLCDGGEWVVVPEKETRNTGSSLRKLAEEIQGLEKKRGFQDEHRVLVFVFYIWDARHETLLDVNLKNVVYNVVLCVPLNFKEISNMLYYIVKISNV